MHPQLDYTKIENNGRLNICVVTTNEARHSKLWNKIESFAQ